jgi:uncharacterized protein DUF4397
MLSLRPGLKIASIIALSSMLVAVSAGNAWALELRFVHAVPGGGEATLRAGKTEVGGPVPFGGVTSYAGVGEGRVQLVLRPASGGKPLARAAETLRGGRMTVVATRQGKQVKLRVLPDGRGSAGRARVRAMNAAPELGSAQVQLDGRPVGSDLPPGQASDYSTVDPGTYKLEAVRPGGEGGALASRSGVNLAAGTSTTAFVVGSGGEPTRIVVASDGAVTPRRAPGTGFGGLAGGTAWAAALAAALGAGVLGGAAYLLATRRRHGA